MKTRNNNYAKFNFFFSFSFFFSYGLFAYVLFLVSTNIIYIL